MINLIITQCWGFGQERGDYPQIRGGKKNWWRNPWISFLLILHHFHKQLYLPSYKTLTSLLGVRSSLFCCSSWPALVRTPLLPSRCSPPRCKASTLEMPCLVSDKSDSVLHSLLSDREGLDLKLSIHKPYSGDIFWYIPVREGNIDRYCP